MKKSKIASSKLGIVPYSSGVTETATEPPLGKAQTLDGITENKGKGVLQVEEDDISECFSEEEKDLCRAGRKNHIFTNKREELATRRHIISEAKSPDSYDVERITFLHICVMGNYLHDLITFHTAIQDGRALGPEEHEEEDDEDDEDDGLISLLENLTGELIKAKLNIEADNQPMLTQSTPMAILRRIQNGLSSLKKLRRQLVMIQSPSIPFSDTCATMKHVEEISMILSFLEELEPLGDENSPGTDEQESQSPQCTDADRYYKRYSNENEREERAKDPQIKKETFHQIVRSRTGCACGGWCAGPSWS